MQDIKCKNCNKTLAKATTFIGAIKCTRCKMIFEYQVFSSSVYSQKELAQS